MDNLLSFDQLSTFTGMVTACVAIVQMADLALIKGFGDGTYKPNQPMSRAEIAVVLGRFYDLMRKEYG